MKARTLIAVLGAGLCVLSVPAQAQERERVQARVKVDDLNLRSAAGRRTADRRIDSAVRAACSASDGSARGMADAQRCEREARVSGAAGVAQVQARQDRMERERMAAERRGASRRMTAARHHRHCYWSKRSHKRVCVRR
jgi:UrcA family protein